MNYITLPFSYYLITLRSHSFINVLGVTFQRIQRYSMMVAPPRLECN
jgi:hypothetical protein